MGCTIFWEAQEFSEICQRKCRDELVALAGEAGWEYDVVPDEFNGLVLNLDQPPEKARPATHKLRLVGVTLFPFGRGEGENRPRLSFIFDNTNPTNPNLRNRLVTLAPASYWLEWVPRARDQYPVLTERKDDGLYATHGDGSMRVRRTELPGFIKFLHTVKTTTLPLLDIRTNDRLARKMISDHGANPFGRGRGADPAIRPGLGEIAEGLGVLFSAHRYDEWRLGLDTEDQIEREQARANRAAAIGPERRSPRGQEGGAADEFPRTGPGGRGRGPGGPGGRGGDFRRGPGGGPGAGGRYLR